MFDISLFAFKGDCWWADYGKRHVGNPMIHLPLRMVCTSLYQPYDHMVIFGMDTYGDFWDGLFMFMALGLPHDFPLAIPTKSHTCSAENQEPR